MSIRRDPFETMERMFDQMRRTGFWDQPMVADQSRSDFDANVSLEREDDAFVVLADLPGFEREEIELTYADDVLTISGVHEDEAADHYRSRSVRESITVPEAVDVSAIDATYKNGVLEVRLPIDESTPTGHQIDIN